MTTALRPPPSRGARQPAAPATPASSTGVGAGPARPEGPPTALVVGTELTLVAVTASAVLGLARLFSDGSFAAPALAAVFASHTLAWFCRRRGLGPVPSALLSGVGLVLAVAWLVEPSTTALGLPGGATWQAIGADLRHAWEQFGEVKAPTAPLRGFVLVVVAAGWTAAAAADLFAFRMRARFEAMAPAFTLFVFGSILGADDLRLPATALYLGATLAFLLWSEAARRSSAGAWFAGRAREGDAAFLRQGAVMGINAMLIALALGPHLPGAASSGLVNWRDGKEGRSRVTGSPLVDIRSRLVEQSDVELFTVRADAPAYWRLTSLDGFDGATWSSLHSYQATKGRLPAPAASTEASRPISQEYAIGALGTIWLPAAFRPERVTGVQRVGYDRDSSSILSESDTADNLQYSVVSALPDLTAGELAGAPPGAPANVARRYLTLPPGFPADVAAEARLQTARATSPYEKARALQDWFRREFVYDTAIESGHDVDAMRRFLTVRRGYCEQFAGTYAAMARAIGLPARVAVGFVPGTLQPDARFHVAGRDAHAWPEVYLSGFGWVSFEPTPGRGAPGAEDYTGVAPAPADSPDASSATIAPPTTAAERTDTTPLEREEPPEPEATPESRSGVGSVVRFLLTVLALLGLLLAAVPLVRARVTRRRRARAVTAREQVLVAWREAEEALALAGHPRRPAETTREFAARTGPALGEADGELAQLACSTTTAAFSPHEMPADEAVSARQASETIERALRAGTSLARRVRWALDPRPLAAELRRTRPDAD